MSRSRSRFHRRAGLGLAGPLIAAVLAGCASGSPPGQPAARAVPLVSGTRITTAIRICDRGAHPYCAREIVLVAPHRYDSGVLKVAERTLLHNSGWHRTEGQTYDEFAAESPGNRLRVTYATAEQDLLAIDERRIQRPAAIVRALSQTLFTREPALSMLLQAGSG